jgi:hypothetical protein
MVAQVRLIMQPRPRDRGTHPSWSSWYLAYVQRFDIRGQSGGTQTDPVTGMHILQPVARSSGVAMGDILPLDQIRSYAHIIPRFGAVANSRLTLFNSSVSEFHDVFFLNKYFDKDFYCAVSLV